VRPRPALLLGALVVPALPLLTAAPAQAAVGVICVGPVPAGTACNDNRATIPAAIAVATSGDTIRPAPGRYTDGPYELPSGVSLRGFGAGTGASSTRLGLTADGQTGVTVSGGGTIADVRVELGTFRGTTGIAASSAVLDNVVVFGPGATDAVAVQSQGSQVHDATANVTGGAGNTGIRSLGGNLLYSDSTWSGGEVGYRLVSGTDNISRITVQLAQTAISVEGGTLNIDDSVLDLGSAGTAGLRSQGTVHGNHLTVVGGGAGSQGVVSNGTVTLANSIVRGPATSLVAAGGTLRADTSDYETPQGTVTGSQNLVGVNPAFVNAGAGNYQLRAGSPVIDKGAASTASTDRLGRARSFDGNGDGTPTPDMGAYELHDVTAPTTVITSGPSGPTNDTTPVFTFRSGPDATFECQLDGGAFQKCASPVTTTPLTDGPHTFTVRAVDPSFNVEPNPPTVRFTVDTRAPGTSFTKKPAKRLFKPKVKFKFASDEAGVHFQCRPDNLPWRSCRSPYRWTVKLGKHRLQVRAVDAAGNQDRSPVSYTFKRIARPKHHHHHHHR
jgi:hypothetical protein